MDKPDFILGIDPGLQGALAVFDNRHLADCTVCPPTTLAVPAAHAVYDMPVHRLSPKSKVTLNAGALADLVGELAFELGASTGRLVSVIENVGSRPRQAGAFNFGLTTGIVHGILASHGIPMASVTPSVWKVAMGLQLRGDESQDQNKSRARALATQLFPDLSEQFKRVKDDGRAEALLLATYYGAKLNGGR